MAMAMAMAVVITITATMIKGGIEKRARVRAVPYIPNSHRCTFFFLFRVLQ